MKNEQKTKVFMSGAGATLALLAIYFAIVGAISGFSFVLSQFEMYWYFLGSLAIGFGIQISLYVYLRYLVANTNMVFGDKTVAVTGTTSTLAMISCCAHYLANIVPILGIAGALSIIAQYQVKIFWVGLAFNVFGIAFIIYKVIKFKKVSRARLP